MPGTTDDLEPYLRALLQENEKLNLTAIRDLDQARVLHVLDSLAVRALDLSPTACLDLGTGNGFPGVALALLHPNARVVLLDRTRKKIEAIDRILAAVGMTEIETLHADAALAPGEHPELVAAFDLVCARAVGRPRPVAGLAGPLTMPGGRLVLWLDAATDPRDDLPGFALQRTVDYDLPEPAARRRKLAAYLRV